MDQVLAEIGKAVAGFFGSPVVQFVLYSILAYLVVLWLASAYWVFRDMQQRTENAILPYLAASLVIVFLPVFPAAVFVYKIIRPHEKIGEVYERNLAEEALLAEVEAIRSCPTCARRVNEDWIICPTCRTRLNRVCPNCSRLVGLDWSLCAWCGKDFERREVGSVAAIEPLPAGMEPTGRIATPAVATIPAAIPTSVRASTRTSPRGSSRSTTASGDPLPER
jgi:RNA polymerase subunit RPABC4/transcription elongation factor Spt4